MRLTKFAPVYPSEGKTNFSKFSGKSGVYIIRHKGKVVYVGMSISDVYKTMTRHFQDWSKSKQRRVEYPQKPEYRARIILCTPKQAARLETALILKYLPRDNEAKINFKIDEKEEKQFEKDLIEVQKAIDKGEVPF